MSNGIERIAAERQRQIEKEGWTPEHDRIEHGGWELRDAAVAYLEQDGKYWPWDGGFKPTPNDRIRELEKAGALIAAEIDRLLEASSE